jgi:hypothetical protein
MKDALEPLIAAYRAEHPGTALDASAVRERVLAATWRRRRRRLRRAVWLLPIAALLVGTGALAASAPARAEVTRVLARLGWISPMTATTRTSAAGARRAARHGGVAASDSATRGGGVAASDIATPGGGVAASDSATPGGDVAASRVAETEVTTPNVAFTQTPAAAPSVALAATALTVPPTAVAAPTRAVAAPSSAVIAHRSGTSPRALAKHPASAAFPPDDAADSSTTSAAADTAAKTGAASNDPHAAELLGADIASYRAAHELHFMLADYARALDAWNAYLARFPRGTFVPEARLNRAVCLARLGRTAQAENELHALATNGSTYTAVRARRVLDALAAR